MNFRNDIQGLRALAFLFVYIFHLNPNWLPGGFIGVDMFFVISGYLISSILINQIEKNEFSFQKFYENRLKRITPAYYFLLFVVSIGIYFIYLPNDLLHLRTNFKTAMFFLSNLTFSSGDSYFGTKLNENPLLHTWSLAIEMQFYFILPMLIYWVKKTLLPLVTGLVIVIISAYTQYKLNSEGFNPELYFSLLTRVPEFLLGTFLATAFKNGVLQKLNGNLISISGLTLIVFSLVFIDKHTPFPGLVALIPCLGVGLLLIAKENWISKLLSTKAFVFIGNLSYSLYLWHWPIMAFLRYRNGINIAYIFSWPEIAIITLLTFLFAWTSYLFIENKYKVISNRNFSIALAPVLLLTLISTYYIKPYSLKNEILFEYSTSSFKKESHYKDSVDRIGSDTQHTPNIFLFGDSHALTVKPLFDELGKSMNIAIKTLTCDTYPAVEGLGEIKTTMSNKKFLDYAKSLISSTKEQILANDIIIFNTSDINKEIVIAQSIAKIASTLRADQNFILIKTYKILTRNPLRINQGYLKNSNEVFEEINLEKNYKTIDSIAHLYKNVHVLDLSKSELYKDLPYYKDTLLYYDAIHLNQRGARLFAKEVKPQLETILAKINSK